MNFDKKGFSLIELLVVIVLIGIISVIVFVNFGNQTPKARNAMRLDSSSKILTAFQIANLEEKIPSSSCLSGSYEYSLGGTISGTGCHISLDGSRDTKNFLKNIKITGSFQDPLNDSVGNDDFIYEFNYKLGSSQQEFVYLTEPTSNKSSFLQTHALNYQSGSLNSLHVDGNFSSIEKIISPIFLKDSNGILISERSGAIVTEQINGKLIIKSFSNSELLKEKLRNIIQPNKQGEGTGTNSDNSGSTNNVTMIFDGKLVFEKYKGMNYNNGIINLGIPSGNTLESANLTASNGIVSFYQLDGNRLIDVFYNTPSENSSFTTDKFTVTGTYYPTNNFEAERISFTTEISFNLSNPLEYVVLNNNSITDLDTSYNNNLVTIPIPENKTLANLDVTSLNGQIIAIAQQGDNQVAFDYKTPASGTGDTITIKGAYYPKDNPFGENVPFVAKINITGLQNQSYVYGTTILAVGGDDAIISTNGGITFTNKFSGGISQDRKYQIQAVGPTEDQSVMDPDFQEPCFLWGTCPIIPGYIKVSSDFGNTWNSQSLNLYVQGVEISNNGQYQYVVVNGNYKYSNDYGVSWNDGSYSFLRMGVSGDGKYLTAIKETSGVYTLYTSSNYGVTWNLNSNYLSSGNPVNISISENGKYQIISRYNGTVVYSSDYGITWNTTGTSGTWYGAAVSEDGKYLLASQNQNGNGGNFAKILKSSDYGVTWDTISTNYEYLQQSYLSYDGKYQIVSNGTVIYKSSDYGITWQVQ